MVNFVIEHWKIITSSIGFIGWLLQFLYCKSERFFLFVNRILLNFRKHKIPIYIHTQVSLTSESNEEDIKRILKSINLSNNEYIPFESKVNSPEKNDSICDF